MQRPAALALLIKCCRVLDTIALCAFNFLRAENIATLSDGMLHGGGSDLMLVLILCTYTHTHTYTHGRQEDGGAELVYTAQRGKSLLWVQFVATLPIQSETLLCYNLCSRQMAITSSTF
jgi:hypothetical protein